MDGSLYTNLIVWVNIIAIERSMIRNDTGETRRIT